jgi:hypothetical protein
MINKYGYNDPNLVKERKTKTISIVLAILFISLVWLVLDYKLLFGDDWISPTYDNEDWKTNEGGLHTFGAWDIETHIWKVEYIYENFPNYQWNPYWYLGMPLLKYYPFGFYVISLLGMLLFGLSAARAVLYLIIFGHLLATLLTFVLCYKLSRRVWASAFLSIFLLASTFITLRSYGWEPVSVAFIFFYPLGLLFFLKSPLQPFRLSVILILTLSYLSHPLIFFALCMTFGLYLFSIAIRKKEISSEQKNPHAIWSYFAAVIVSLFIGAVQFFPQMSYEQVTSGAHMGVSYIPFYHVPFNVINIFDFMLDAGNLKGPSLIVMIAFLLVIIFGIWNWKQNKKEKIEKHKKIFGNELISGLLFVLTMMVLFYYLEMFNIFPMNYLRSIQYHRIIPEFIIASAAFIAALSNILDTKEKKIIYYSVIIIFMIASFFVIYNVQLKWQTESNISNSQEFIYDDFDGRITFPYTSQSLAVRSSFRNIPQVYGYYEQGITNAYADEIFSVSSGFHDAETSLIYLKSVNVKRMYINMQEGQRDEIVFVLFKEKLNFTYNEGERYGYYEIPLKNPGFAQAIDREKAEKIKELEPGCRVFFKEKHCGSVKEEFVSVDTEETKYLEQYNALIEEDYFAIAEIEMINPEFYKISVKNASVNSAVIIKMTHDKDFRAFLEGNGIEIYSIGPDFMIIYPEKSGDYVIDLEYTTTKVLVYGGIVSVVSMILVIIFFIFRKKFNFRFKFGKGELA